MPHQTPCTVCTDNWTCRTRVGTAWTSVCSCQEHSFLAVVTYSSLVTRDTVYISASDATTSRCPIPHFALCTVGARLTYQTIPRTLKTRLGCGIFIKANMAINTNRRIVTSHTICQCICTLFACVGGNIQIKIIVETFRTSQRVITFQTPLQCTFLACICNCIQIIPIQTFKTDCRIFTLQAVA